MIIHKMRIIQKHQSHLMIYTMYEYAEYTENSDKTVKTLKIQSCIESQSGDILMVRRVGTYKM